MRYFNFSLLATALFGFGCGGGQQNEYIDDQYDGKSTPNAAGSSKQQTVTIPMAVKSESDAGFSLLASATSFDIDVDTCQSGYTGTATEASPNLEVYSYDVDCEAKLVEFIINGQTYQPSTDFTTWNIGDTAVFENTGDNTDQLAVEVIDTLSSPVDSSDTVEYQFSDIVLGADETLAEAAVSEGLTMVVDGQAAPDFVIDSVTLSGITAGGAGQFDFVFECSEAITGAAATRACKDSTMVDLDYKLVQDTYSGTLTVAEANAIFDASETDVVDGDSHDAATTTTNGGFTTATTDGPDAMHNNPNMIVILRVADLSYQYFNVDITVVSQN